MGGGAAAAFRRNRSISIMLVQIAHKKRTQKTEDVVPFLPSFTTNWSTFALYLPDPLVGPF